MTGCVIVTETWPTFNLSLSRKHDTPWQVECRGFRDNDRRQNTERRRRSEHLLSYYKTSLRYYTGNNRLNMYFSTIRLRCDISHDCCLHIIRMLKQQKLYKQMLFCVEKKNTAGPCTHHIHIHLYVYMYTYVHVCICTLIYI